MKVITIVTSGEIAGSLYRPEDNSYAKDLTNNTNRVRVYLHTFVLSSEPYKKQVHEGVDLKILGPKERMMVKGIDPVTGFEYEMMYEPEWLLE